MTLHYVASLELLPAELAGIAGGDATLVAEVPGDGVLVLVGPATLITKINQAVAVSPGDQSQVPVGLLHVHHQLGIPWKEHRVRKFLFPNEKRKISHHVEPPLECSTR